MVQVKQADVHSDLTSRHVNVCHQVLDGSAQLILEAMGRRLGVLARFCWFLTAECLQALPLLSKTTHVKLCLPNLHSAIYLNKNLTWTRGCCPEFWCGRGRWGVSGAPVLWSVPQMYTVSGSPGINPEATSSGSSCDKPASPVNSRRTWWVEHMVILIIFMI